MSHPWSTETAQSHDTIAAFLIAMLPFAPQVSSQRDASIDTLIPRIATSVAPGKTLFCLSASQLQDDGKLDTVHSHVYTHERCTAQVHASLLLLCARACTSVPVL